MHAPPVKQGGGDRWRWMMQDLLAAKASWLLVLCMLLVHALVQSRPDAEQAWLFSTFGLSREGLLAGKAWQLFTHGFFHGNGIHLFINSLGLLLIGSRVERIYGSAALGRVFLAGVLAGGVAQVLLAPPSQRVTRKGCEWG